jgi:hypothetical protein
MGGFLGKLRSDARRSGLRRGESPDKVDQFNYLAAHSAPATRVQRATALTRKKNIKNR